MQHDKTRGERENGERNESMYERCGMRPCLNEVKYDVVEWWFGYVEKIEE